MLQKRFASAAKSCPSLCKGDRDTWLIDTATSNHVVGDARTVIPGTEKSISIDIDTATGAVHANSVVDVEVEGIGTLDNCIRLDKSPNLVCPGAMVEDHDWGFHWTKSTGPYFVKNTGEVMMLETESRVPVHRGTACSAALMDETIEQLVTDALVAELAEGFGDLTINDQAVVLIEMLAFPVKHACDHIHQLTHLPSLPKDCEACNAKMSRKPAKRLTEEQRALTTAKEYGEKVHLDLVGPTSPTYKNERYLAVLRDEATGFADAPRSRF